MEHRMNAAPSAPTQTTRRGASLAEVRSAGTMGKGLFATQDIPRGTRIIDEGPLFVVYDRPPHDEMSEEACVLDVDAFCGTARWLSDDKLKKLDRLYYDANYDTADDKNRIQDWYRAEDVTDEQGRVLSEKNLMKTVMLMARRYAIFKDNSARVGVDDTGEDSGIFLLYSRINHSCSPNAHAHYNGTTERLTVHATRHIKAGEQIFVQYVDNACLPRDKRQEQAKKFGFTCECPACTTDMETEPLRVRMYILEQGIMRYVDNDPAEAFRMAESPDQALLAVQELIRLLQDPSIDLQNSTLRNAYRAGFKISLELGDVQSATEYAKKDLKLTICMVGTDDTEYLHGDGNTDQHLAYWYRYLENMDEVY
ncbi:SET domain-containing protein 5 [Cytospora mali]|uniref:SET domain-containing protein 5 n=1 Tax=Cytospora mali TaxID=578113 RepID=A0A194V551_CYTMA|nr:SET domain-containing protein 5 [Valsa mali var. pyri (nom. inval.)]